MTFPFLPDILLSSLTDITPELLRQYGARYLLMDFDNTIVPYTTNMPTKAMTEWISRMQASEIRLCVVSNSKKPRVRLFCQQYGLDCITHARKPFQRGIREAKKKYGFLPREAALVGDQIYTDVLGANCGGLTSILIPAIHNHTIWLKLRHVAELPFIWIGRAVYRRKLRNNVSDAM